jgi:hypothetical protein
MRNAVLVAIVACLVSCSRDQASPSQASSVTPSSVPAPSASAPGNDGTDPKAPVLSPDDANFVDTRKGGGWGDRCFTEIKRGKWGWAHAACDRALALPDVDPKVRPLLLYNEGLIAKHAGDNTGAQNYFGQSLMLRDPADPGRAEVQKQLVSVGGTVAPALPIETYKGQQIVEQLSYASVKPMYSDLTWTTLYHADINNDGHLEWVVCEKNPVGLHNDMILGVYAAAPSSGVIIDSTIPLPSGGPFQNGPTYLGTPFLRNDPEGVTMTFLEGPANKPARYIWRGGRIQLLDRG